MKVFLDDVREPSHIHYTNVGWTTVRSYAEFVALIEEYVTQTGKMVDFISFDHDLAIEHYTHLGGINWENRHDIDYSTLKEKTGYDCAKWLTEFCMSNNLEFPNYHVHSFNPVGAENIRRYIENFKRSRQ